jgi:hypothetical protein
MVVEAAALRARSQIDGEGILDGCLSAIDAEILAAELDRLARQIAAGPVPAVDCDIDHKRPAARGGPTSQFNGRAGCHGHNRIPELRDDPTEMPERDLHDLDVLRAGLRWAYLHHRVDDDSDDDSDEE